MQFGRPSEKLRAAITQLELVLEDLEEEQGAPQAAIPAIETADAPGGARPARRQLAEHLPSHVFEHVTVCACATCGGIEPACWTHVRRKFHGIHAADNVPIAEEALTHHCPVTNRGADHRQDTQPAPPRSP